VSRDDARRVLGFMSAPLVAAVLTFAINLAFERNGFSVLDGPATIDFSIGLALSSLFVGVPLTLFVAVPVFLWLAGRGLLSFARTVLAAALLAVSWYAVLIVGIPAFRVISGDLAVDMYRLASAFEGWRLLRLLVFLAAIGMGTGAAFWIIGVRGTELDPRHESLISVTRFSNH
jgi:hypothetical protein